MIENCSRPFILDATLFPNVADFMEYNTSELCDTYIDMVDVVEPMFSSFGGRNSFGGSITTIKCFESNGLISDTVKEDGQGRVLLIDGGGSLRRALIDADLAETAAENGWEGIICYGCVREVDALDELDIGIQALASIPVGADTNDIGELQVPVNFGGVTFLPADYVYADTTGVILSPEPLDIEDEGDYDGEFDGEFDDSEDDDQS